VENGPFNEIGFWEISWGAGNPSVYNISGAAGIKITFETGEIILIGSQNPGQLARLINKMTTRLK
jgi:hypothetical protein